MTRLADILETRACSRCGGSGKYSWCQMYGDRCFRCAGRGWEYTKRGAAAAAYWRHLMSAPASLVRAGDRIRIEASPFSRGGWATVREVGPSTSRLVRNGEEIPMIAIVAGGETRHELPDSLVRFSNAYLGEAALKSVADFQSMLTKQGKPAKRSRIGGG